MKMYLIENQIIDTYIFIYVGDIIYIWSIFKREY